jgi:hypothetical protein
VEGGEEGAVDQEVVIAWRAALPRQLAGWKEEDVFNADETALFWRVLPNKTLHFKGDKCSGGKRSKERITVLLVANMAGTEKQLLAIGNSANPRAFKKSSPPAKW